MYYRLKQTQKYDIRKMQKIIDLTIGKLSDKTAIPQTFKIYNTDISDPRIITDNFCDFLTNFGVKDANNIPPSVKSAHNYLNLKKTRNPYSITPIDPNEIIDILKTIKYQKKALGMINLI